MWIWRVTCLWIAVLVAPLCAAEDAVLKLPMSRIFGDEILQSNIRHFLKQTTPLPESERLEVLTDWVLPTGQPRKIRLSCLYDSDRQFFTAQQSASARQDASDGQLISPALHLVELAARLNRLDKLREQVRTIPPSGEVQERCRIALMTLIEVERTDFKAAEKWLDDLRQRHAQKAFADLEDRWPETVALTVAVRHVKLHGVAEPMLMRILTDQVRKGTLCGPPAWDRHIAALMGTLRLQQRMDLAVGATSQVNNEPPTRDWIPVTGCDEATKAMGFPALRWQRTGNEFEKVIGHQDDSLLYRIPLRGDFTVEADAACFNYQETQSLVGGRWFTPHYTHDTLEDGDLRGMISLQPLKPKLSLVGDWARQRVVIRNGQCETYFNGRLFRTEAVRPHQFPWIGFRSPFFANGRVRNVQISGAPEIPETISLSSDPNLSGWVRFHLDRVCGSEPDWDFSESPGQGSEIIAHRKARFQDTFQESLLRYVRPMVEDGVVEYEFFHSPGECHVHPALDQLVFLIEPEGLSLHQVTNGIHDASGLDPRNRIAVMPRVPCPLVQGWNQLNLIVAGDVVQIVLNGDQVYEGPIPAGNDRTIGLFHYADQTAVRVRNMRWTGSWPQVLPPISQQELRRRELDELEARVAQLTNRVVYDFAHLPKSTDKTASLTYSGKTFQFQTSDQRGTATLKNDGLEMVRPGSGSFSDVWAAPRLRLTGDFDIEATFENLQLGTPENGTNAIYLIVVTDDEEITHSRVWHGNYAHPNIDLRQATQSEFNRYVKGRPVNVEFNGVTSEECTSGRLRIVRLGKRMTFLIAEDDSSYFRVIHSAEENAAPLRVDGIRLGAGNWGNPDSEANAVRVLWKRLSIRSPISGIQKQP